MAYLREHPEGLHRNSTELDDILRSVDEGGYVLLWSILLGDLIACYKTQQDREAVPPEFVPYSRQEFIQLFGQPGAATSSDSLRLIHEAKKRQGRGGLSQRNSKPAAGWPRTRRVVDGY